MNTPSEASQIPPLELLDKVEEDALGCVHCATWKPGEEREEVVLARLFEPGSVDLECFLETTAERQRLLEDCSSHFVITSRRHQINDNQAVDVLPYVSGSSLGSLIRSAIKSRVDPGRDRSVHRRTHWGRLVQCVSDARRRRRGASRVCHTSTHSSLRRGPGHGLGLRSRASPSRAPRNRFKPCRDLALSFSRIVARQRSPPYR